MDYYQQQPTTPQPPVQPPSEPPRNSGMAIAALVLGIISIPLGCCYGIGILPAIIAIVLAVVSKKETGTISGFAIGALICSVVGILCGIAFWVFFMIGVAQLGGFENALQYYGY